MYKIQITRAVPRFPEFQFHSSITWEIEEGENWALVGPNGSGKTLLIDILQGRIVLKAGEVKIQPRDGHENRQIVKSMAFRDIYSLTDCRNIYYQQRWNASDADNAPLVETFLREFPLEKVQFRIRQLGIEDTLKKRIIALSSGELRKFLIAKTLLTDPEVLILDNPFIGLDALSRQALSDMLGEISRISGLQIILVLSDPKDLPGWIDKVLPVKDKQCLAVKRLGDFLSDNVLIRELFPELSSGNIELPQSIQRSGNYDTIINMEKIRIYLGKHVILNGVDWTVRKGEKWALLGPNGSGKSTLLSLVYGDNPQAYANQISLFGRRRGTGESIWDIKKRIGYLSPDMHTYYLEDIPCLEVVASGFFDSIGLWKKCTEEQRKKAEEWLTTFQIRHLSQRSFVKISYGEQRLVLLVRAFVKDPELLILDEPLHGLDMGKKRLVEKIIAAFCEQQDKTLIYVTHYKTEIPDCVGHFKELKR